MECACYFATQKFVYDGENILHVTDESDLTQAVYTLDPRQYGLLVSQRQNDGGWQTLYHHFDALGSTDSLTDASQVVTDTYTYYAFGELKTSTGTTANPYTWVAEVGYWKDTDLDRFHLGAREYEPEQARFISKDPLGYDLGRNPFEYVGNDPINSADPSGMQKTNKPKDPKLGVWMDNAGRVIPVTSVDRAGKNGWFLPADLTLEPVQYIDGRPDFTFLEDTVKKKHGVFEVDFIYGATENEDFNSMNDNARKLNPSFTKAPEGYTWHHVSCSIDPKTGMAVGKAQLVPSPYNNANPKHAGGRSDFKAKISTPANMAHTVDSRKPFLAGQTKLRRTIKSAQDVLVESGDFKNYLKKGAKYLAIAGAVGLAAVGTAKAATDPVTVLADPVIQREYESALRAIDAGQDHLAISALFGSAQDYKDMFNALQEESPDGVVVKILAKIYTAIDDPTLAKVELSALAEAAVNLRTAFMEKLNDADSLTIVTPDEAAQEQRASRILEIAGYLYVQDFIRMNFGPPSPMSELKGVEYWTDLMQRAEVVYDQEANSRISSP